MPADAAYLAANPVAPASQRDTDLRVMFIHGGGSTDGDDRENEPFARYLRARFEHFSMQVVRHTSDFELVIRTHAEEAQRFRPDVIVGRSQGGPTILELMHRGLWNGPSVLCCPAIVPTVDDHLQHLPDNVPLLLATGNADEQVPLERVQGLYDANHARLQRGLGLIVVEDVHALCSLLDDGQPAAHLAGSAGVDPSCGTLYDMVQTVWAMRECVASKKGYAHLERLPAAGGEVSGPTTVVGHARVLDELLAHVQARVGTLRKALGGSASVHVTIAGEGGAPSLGKGAAKEQWRRQLGASAGADAHAHFIEALDRALLRLAADFPQRVHFGAASGAAASAEHYQVWGANARNWRRPDGARVSGSGQAAAMGVQRPGVFGIVTTPKYPLHEVAVAPKSCIVL